MSKLWIYQCEIRYNGEMSYRYVQVEVKETNKLYKSEKSMPFIYSCQVKKEDIGKIKESFGSYKVILTERDDEKVKEIISVRFQEKILQAQQNLTKLNEQYERFKNIELKERNEQ